MSKAYHFSSVGPVEIEATSKGISSLKFGEKAPDSRQTKDPLLLECIEQLEGYFAGKLKTFDLPLDFGAAGHFYSEVWHVLCSIPYGKTRSYTSVAEVIASHSSSRAVGKAIGMNPIAIIVPCHRVIGKHGKLKGYAYGVNIKRSLLQLENPARFMSQQSIAFDYPAAISA